MGERENKPGTDSGDQPDPLSATGMFSKAGSPQSSKPQKEPVSQEGKGSPGEFTQLFQSLNPASPPSAVLSEPSREASNFATGEFTRIFVRSAATPPAPPEKAASPAPAPNPPRLRGFSSPGNSDSASGDGGFTQLFRAAPSLPAPAPAAQPPTRDAGIPSEWPMPSGMGASGNPGSVTMLMQKLSEDRAAASPAPVPVLQVSAEQQFSPSGPGEYTRIISGNEIKAAANAPTPPPAPAPAKIQIAQVEPPKPAPLPAPAALPKNKLQEMLPILLVLNAFLLVVLIVLVILAIKAK